MSITLTIIAGPDSGREFNFDQRDTFLVGRSKFAHFQIADDYLSSIHFMMEWKTPRCRLIDLGSHNGTYVNGVRILSTELLDGDQVRAGRSTFRLVVSK